MQHYVNDPSVKLETRTKLFQFLYEPADKKLQYELEMLIKRFAITSESKAEAFMYKGEVYCSEGYRPVRGQKLKLLSKNLYDSMDKYLVLKKELEQEKAVVKDFLTCLLIKAENSADILALLPDCLKNSAEIYNSELYPPTLSSESIQEFFQKYSNYIQTIKERVVLNIIL